MIALISKCPDFVTMTNSMLSQSYAKFTIQGVEMDVLILGIEKAPGKGDLVNLKVSIKELRRFNNEHFIVSPSESKGKWHGTFDLDHKPYMRTLPVQSTGNKDLCNNDIRECLGIELSGHLA